MAPGVVWAGVVWAGVVWAGARARAARVMLPVQSERAGAQATRPLVAEVSGPAVIRSVEWHVMVPGGS